MKYLAQNDEDGSAAEGINAVDNEGWTALHNACSKGYLEVVMWLAENGADVDARSNQGYTPLMNAASKGHLPIVRYLLARHSPDPFIRNAYNETAYDVAVATFELGIADILADYESRLWQEHQSTTASTSSQSLTPYNPLGMHITVPIVVYENQRLDLRWLSRTRRTLSNPVASTSGSTYPSGPSTSVKFTSAALSRRDGHASSELPPSYDGLNPSKSWPPVRRSDIDLPSILNPRQIQLPSSTKGRPTLQRNAGSSRSNRSATSSIKSVDTDEPTTPRIPSEAEPAWFWLSSRYFVDLSPSNVDPEHGWQYATSFDAPDDDWLDHMPMEVGRILAGDLPPTSRGIKWVRRRRWARVMRRRIDIPHWGFDDDPPSQASFAEQGKLEGDGGVGEIALTLARDYLERAQYFAGSHAKHGRAHGTVVDASPSTSNDGDTMSVRSMYTVIAGAGDDQDIDRASARRIVARLERALHELEEGMDDDHDEVRKLQAVTLAEIFRERLEALEHQFPQIEGNDDAESFRYPGADDNSELDETSSISTSLRSASLNSPISNGSPISFRRDSGTHSLPFGSPASRQQASFSPRPDLARQLSANPDFRVPTSEEPRFGGSVPVHYTLGRSIFDRDAPQPTSTATAGSARSTIPWEPDEATSECRRCQRKFTFFLRKHHCRKCGLVVCAHCSSHHDYLRANEVVLERGASSASGVFDPLYGMYSNGGGFYRTCDVCHDAVQNAANQIDPDLLLAPNYFTASARTGAHTSVGPTIPSSSPSAAPTPTFAHYTEAVDNGYPMGSEHDASHASRITEADGSPMQRSISDMSDLGECPVCGTNLDSMPDKAEQEAHVQSCLESGTSSRLQDNRYLVFTLPESSPLVGTDCLICFESYEAGEQIGRLSCLCHFHRHCIANWLSRGKSCPVHAR